MTERTDYLKATLEAVADALLAVDLSGGIISVNKRFGELWHIPESIFYGHDAQRLTQYIMPQLEDPVAFLAGISEMYAHPEIDTFEQIELKDGRIFERISRPLWISGHRIGGIVVSYRDATVRLRMEESLRVNMARFKTVFMESPLGIGITDVTKKTIQGIQVNPAFSKMVGYTPEDITRLGLQGVSHPDDFETEMKLLAKVERGEQDSYAMEKRYLRADGTLMWGNLVVYVGRDDRRVPVSLIAMVTDITETKRIMDELKKSEERYRILYDRTPIMMYSVDSEGTIVAVSDCLLETLGYERGEVMGRKSTDFMTAYSRKQAMDWVGPSFFKAGSVKNISYHWVKRNGETIETLLSAILQKDARGTMHTLAVLIDVTERNRFEKQRDELLVTEHEARLQAQKALELREEFIAMASHELKTPITPLKLQVSLILRHLRVGIFSTYPKAKELVKSLEGARQQLDRLSKLIDNMLNVSRISAGRFEPNFSVVDLSELVLTVTSRLTVEAEAAGYHLNVRISPNVRVACDSLLIEQSISNLVTNAIKYGDGKPIDVHLETTDGDAELRVLDHGIGISKSDQGRIFNRFERAVSLKDFGGFGLGLYITRQIVLAHGGVIFVESERGSGACFVIRLPLASAGRDLQTRSA